MRISLLFILLQAIAPSSPEPTPAPEAACVVQMDITDFPATPEQIQRMCGGPNTNIKQVTVSGGRAAARYEIMYKRDHRFLQIAGTPLFGGAMETALTVRRIFKQIYPSEKFFFGFRDGNGLPICGFSFSGDNEYPDDGAAGCVIVIKPGAPPMPHEHEKPKKENPEVPL